MRTGVSRKSRSGFTLIELVVASAIAAILIGAVFQVLVMLLADRHRLAAAKSSEPDQSVTAMVAMIRTDLASATQLKMDKSGSVLLALPESTGKDSPSARWSFRSNHSIAPTTLLAVDRPAIVTYWLEQDHDQTWLLRQQFFTDDVVPARPWRALLAAGVKSFSIQLLQDEPKEQNTLGEHGHKPDQTSPPKQKGAITAAMIPPRRVRLKVDFTKGQAPIDQVLCLH